MNLMDLFVKISVDDQASSQVETIGSKLKGGLATAAKVGAAAVAAAGTAVVAIGKQAVDQYAEYEQLVGGVETLFKQSSDIVMGYAENAYKTAGLSANEYMNTVTSFSASLLQSLGGDTEEAAKYADMAITDMSDNANKMGTSMEMIQNAYQGFAKQNYTMLDNLKLGYGGTKEEMQRLLEDAEKLSGIEYDISSYADIVDAIHVVQTEMGITGTTAQEASTTIQGSVASMKSAWQNLVTGIADENADLDTLIGNFVDSVATAGENIIPRVEQILLGVGTLVSQLAPIIAEEIPKIVIDVLPSLLESGISMLDGIAAGIIDALPSLLETAIEIVLTIADGIAQNLPELIPTLVDVVIQITETLIDNVDMLVDAAIEIMIALADGLINALPKLIEKVPVIITKLIEAYVNNAPKMIEASLKIIIALAEGLITSIPEIIKAIPQIVTAIVNGFKNYMSQIKDIGKNIVNGVWEGIQSMASWITGKVKSFFSGIVDSVKGVLGIHSPSRIFAGIGENMALGLSDGWDSEYNKIKRNITNGLDFGTATIDAKATMSGKLQNALTNIGNIGGDINIVVQSVLDGKIIGETAYKYNRQMQRAMGV